MRDRLHQYELDPTLGISVRPRLRKYRINDQAIKTLVTEFDTINYPNDEEIFHHLRALQYRLKKNNIEHWDL